jgi:hypothetical protein
MRRRILIIIIVNIAITSSVGLISLICKNDYSSLMPNLSELRFYNKNGNHYMNSQGRKVLVIYFSLNCEHCLYQIKVIERNITKLTNTKIYFITSDPDLFTSSFLTQFKNLEHNELVYFGIVDLKDFQSIAKVKITPTLFFFNTSGHFQAKIIGEVRIEKIIETFEHFDVRPAS